MKLIRTLLLPVLFVAMWSLTGCNEEPITSVTPDNTPSLSKLTLPAGAVISSATINVYVEDPTTNNVTVHKVNVPWTEAETWNSFFANPDPEFDPASLGNFNGTAGLHTVDITSLVQAWVDGTTANNGVLLNQPVSADGFTVFRSSEYIGTNQPFLEVTYTVNGGTPETVQEPAFADTYILQTDPDNSFGSEEYLRLAHIGDYRKFILVQFDVEQAQLNCETAYAYGAGASLQTLCFLDIPNIQGSNWGWTNQIAPGTYNWPIYAGAGQCDITKGTLVGNLNVVYAAGTATITFQPNPGVTLGDTHVWVGTNGNLLPSSRGKWITAPGQFNYNGVNPVVVTGLSGNIWIAAHSGEACW